MVWRKFRDNNATHTGYSNITTTQHSPHHLSNRSYRFLDSLTERGLPFIPTLISARSLSTRASPYMYSEIFTSRNVISPGFCYFSTPFKIH